MPDFPARSEASTSAASLPMGETMPIPVMTTRRMEFSFTSVRAQRDLHVLDQIDGFAVGFHPAIGHAHGQAAGLHRLGEIDVVGEALAVGADHAGQLDLAHAKRI